MVPNTLGLNNLHPEPSPLASDHQAQSPTQLHYRNKVQHRRFSMEVSSTKCAFCVFVWMSVKAQMHNAIHAIDATDALGATDAHIRIRIGKHY